jgi:hypothetical protein
MVKNSLKHKRMKGGAGDVFESLFTNKIFGLSWFTMLSIFLIPGVFVGTWAGFGFDTSYETISIPLLATTILCNIFIIPIMYWYKVSKYNLVKLGHSWMPDIGISWKGFFSMLIFWITAGLIVAIGFGGTGTKYDTGIIRGLATVGIIFTFIGSLDIFMHLGGSLVKYFRNQPRSPTKSSSIELNSTDVEEPYSNDDYNEPEQDMDGNLNVNDNPDLSSQSVDEIPNSYQDDIEPEPEPEPDSPTTVGGRIHKRRRSRSNSRRRRRNK